METILPLITLLIGLAAGFAIAWFGKSLSAKALNENSEAFLRLAETRFQTLQAAGAGDLDKRTLAINEMVKPMTQRLEALNVAINQISGTDKSLAEQISGLQKETARIAGALNNPRERGRSAEMLLERLFEHAGLLRDINYRTQVVDGDIRPDFVVELKDSLRVVIDCKAPLIDVMDELQNPETQALAAQKLAQQVRAHIKALSAKKYNSINGSVDFTVLFLPGDGLYALAVDTDRDLIDYAAQHNIVLSSPMLLFGLLRMVHAMGRQQSLNQNAEEIRKLGADLHKRMKTFMDHFMKIRATMLTTFKHYNAAVSSLESRVLPAARKFEDLQAVPSNQALENPLMLEIVGDEENPADSKLGDKAA